MAFQQDNGFQRQMFEGNWTCSKCGAAITRLPFQPDPERLGSLLCSDCNRARKTEGRGSRDGGFRESKRFEGNWTCSKCGAAITSLPFNPDPSKLDTLLCFNCNREKRMSSRRY